MKIIGFLTASILFAFWPLSKKAFVNHFSIKTITKHAQNASIDDRNDELTISYTMHSATKIEPKDGSNFRDMNRGDIRMLQESPASFDVTNTIDSEGNSCIVSIKSKYSLGQENERSDDRSGREDEDNVISKTTICNDQMTIEVNGAVRTSQMQQDKAQWKELFKGYALSERQLKNDFWEMIDVAKQNGAEVSEGESTIQIKQVLPSGKIKNSIFNKSTFVLLFAELSDDQGVLKTFRYQYTCSQSGKTVPKSVIITSTEKAPISNQKVLKTKWTVFENYSITL